MGREISMIIILVYHGSMGVLASHALLFGAFFTVGVLFGYGLTFILMQASKLRY